MDDLIRKQDVLKALWDFFIVGFYDEAMVKGTIGIIKELPSAQPDLQPTCNQLATDCISRKAAMSFPLSWEHYDEKNGNTAFICGVECYRDYIEALPAERQEIIRCKDCAAYGTMMHGKDERMICHRFALNFPEDFYCADAERRKDGRPNQQTGGD